MRRILIATTVLLSICSALSADPSAMSHTPTDVLEIKKLYLKQIVTLKDGGSTAMEFTNEKGGKFWLIAICPAQLRSRKEAEQVFELCNTPAMEREIVTKGSAVELHLRKLLKQLSANLIEDPKRDKERVDLIVSLFENRSRPWPF